MTPSEPREDAVAVLTVMRDFYAGSVLNHPEKVVALDAAIAALAQQGAEPVAHRWLRDGEPAGQWVDGMPSERQFQAAKDCAEIATWTVEYAYAPATGAPRP